jgi:hypothetical protein
MKPTEHYRAFDCHDQAMHADHNCLNTRRINPQDKGSAH